MWHNDDACVKNVYPSKMYEAAHRSELESLLLT